MNSESLIQDKIFACISRIVNISNKFQLNNTITTHFLIIFFVFICINQPPHFFCSLLQNNNTIQIIWN